MIYPPELARADHLLSADELRRKYGTEQLHAAEHPRFQRWEWREAVVNDDTLRGYWDWVQHELEAEHDDEP